VRDRKWRGHDEKDGCWLPRQKNYSKYGMGARGNIPQKECRFVQHSDMRPSLDKELALFLRKKRGDLPFAVFAKKLGITPSSLFRLENCQQSLTLKTLQQILNMSPVTSKPATKGRIKTGHSEWLYSYQVSQCKQGLSISADTLLGELLMYCAKFLRT
jgi:hypothetical protein